MNTLGNQLILGDCLEVLKTLPDSSVDLCYIDPPFFSNRNYEVIWGDEGEVRSFKDRWAGGTEHYIAWLKERVEEIHKVLKPTGSFYLHCDWHADAYLRVYVLDKVFGEKYLKNQIVWYYNSGGGSKKFFTRNHDTIFFYTKSNKYNFNPDRIRIARTEKSLERAKNPKGSRYSLSNKNKLPEDVFQIQILNPMSKERIGYPTQKPEELLERIIKASSNEGDVVLDCFCGGGTTLAVADKLKRNWIGIDQSVQAIKISEGRIEKQRDLFSSPFAVKLHKYDYDTLRYKDAFDFEKWIIEQYGGESNVKQRGDYGIDGKKNKTPLQVKRSDNIGRNVIDNFINACRRYDETLFGKHKKDKEPVGIIIAFSFGRGAVQEVARLKNEDNIIIELVCVDEIVPIAKKPEVNLNFTDFGLNKKEERVIEFYVEPKEGIEFFEWCFAYDTEKEEFKPDVLLDREGKQRKPFKPGQYNVAVKAIDSNGLESLEVIIIKINGETKRIK